MKYSQEVLELIVKNISLGALDVDAANNAGIGESTFYDWQREYESDKKTLNPNYHVEFVEAIKKAKANRTQTLCNQIIRDKSWQAKAWYLERTEPEKFAKKEKGMEVKGDGKIEVIFHDYE